MPTGNDCSIWGFGARLYVFCFVGAQIQLTGGPDTGGGGGDGGTGALVERAAGGGGAWGSSGGGGFDTEDTSDEDVWHKNGSNNTGLGENGSRREQNSLVEKVMKVGERLMLRGVVRPCLRPPSQSYLDSGGSRRAWPVRTVVLDAFVGRGPC